MYTVIVWTNSGERIEYPEPNLALALATAKRHRSLAKRTVKIAHDGDSIRHWSRTITAKRNHWATHSTAECSR